MKPTMKLRWVTIKKGLVAGGENAPGRFGPNDLMLQQWWEADNSGCDVYLPNGPAGEWRDIEVKED